MQTKQTEKKMPWKWYAIAVIAATGVMMITMLFPIWHWFPVLVTEDVTVVAITNGQCVAETSFNYPITIGQCSAGIGETVTASFYVPASDVSGYHDRLQEKVELINP